MNSNSNLYNELRDLYNMVKVTQNELIDMDKGLNNSYKNMDEARELIIKLNVIHNKRVTKNIVDKIMSNTKQNKKINKYVNSFQDVETMIDDYLLSFD